LNTKKIIVGIGFVLLALAVFVYVKAFSANTKFEEEKKYVFIPTGATYEDVLKILATEVENIEGFKFVAEKRAYDENVFPGRFLLKKGMGSFQIVSALRHNEPLNLSFNNQETIEKLVSRVSSQMEVDSLTLMKSLKDSVFMNQNGFNEETILAMFIPNTYEVKWNLSANDFRDKMAKECKKFWNEERLTKAKALNMTPVQVMTLASIVHKETVKQDERPRVAGVYLNRLKAGMPLQADPTIIFALRKKANNQDLVIKRVFEGDLRINSPYNTYVHLGLPPGPVAMPDISAIDAVLSPENHKFIYFCASVERFGYHEFAETFNEHVAIAKKYRDWVANQGVTR